MTHAIIEHEIQLVRDRLQTEINEYRTAIANDVELFFVKKLYQKAKASMRELKLLMIDYENLINEDMKNFDNQASSK